MSDTPAHTGHAAPSALAASGEAPAAGLTLETALSAGVPAAAAAGAGAPRPWQARARGLRTWLWLLLAIGLLPALAGTAWYLVQLRSLAMRDAFAQADLMANGTAEALRWEVQDAQVLLAAAASRPSVRQLDAGSCDPLFREFQSMAPLLKTLALRRSDGQSLCSSLASPPGGAETATAPWFQAALQAGRFHVSGVHLGPVEGRWTVRFTHPVARPDGTVGGLLVSPLDLAQMHRRVFARTPLQARVAVVDGDNRLVLQSQRQDERVGKPAAAHLVGELQALRHDATQLTDASTAVRQFVDAGFDGPQRLFSMRTVPQTDWVVVASLPLDETLAGYRHARNRVLAAVLLVLLGVAGAAWRVGRGILDPIRGLADAARGVAAGDDSLRAPEAGPREIAAVAREFNRMVVADTQARDLLRASEAQYRALIENLPVAVVTHRPDSAIEVFNDRACAMLRVTRAQMEGRTALDRAWHFVDEQGRRLPVASYPVNRLLQTRQPLSPTVIGIVQDDPAVPPVAHSWAMVTGYPQFAADGTLLRAIVAFVDVTGQREATALRLAKESAEAASKAKSLFLSRVSHELRTPLNAINGFTELVLLEPQVPDASKDKLRHVLNAGQHLLSLINQVLDLSQAESAGSPAALQPLALWPLLEECVALCGPLAQARGVQMRLPVPPAPPPQVLADPTPLRQVLLNLLSNAVKYNRPDGLVTVQCEAQAAADGGRPPMWLLHVRDTGPGLTSVQQSSLFQPFNRLGAEFSGVEGHGLGLSIARMLAQAMGGDITVHSQPGDGATFTLALRAA